MKGYAYMSRLEMKKRAAFNIGCDDGSQFTINDDDDVQGHDPGTGRSVDVGGCSYTLYDDYANITAEGLDGLLAYDNIYPPTNIVFEAPGKLKAVQDGVPVDQGNGFWLLKFDVIKPK